VTARGWCGATAALDGLWRIGRTMLDLIVPRTPRRALRVLCVGAHCDDIDIGCGGALLRLIAERGRVDVCWAVFSGGPDRTRELRASARRFLRGAARATVITHEFRDSYFPGQYAAIKESFELLKRLPDPDLIFTHGTDDLHQDHRIIGDLTWNTFRRHLILEYEIPKYDAGLPPPNAYFPLTRAQGLAKIRILMSCYRSQLSKSWFTEETFRALLRLRGIESAAESGWAEAFHARKLCLR